jgi:hypothetical protein
MISIVRMGAMTRLTERTIIMATKPKGEKKMIPRPMQPQGLLPK